MSQTRTQQRFTSQFHQTRLQSSPPKTEAPIAIWLVFPVLALLLLLPNIASASCTTFEAPLFLNDPDFESFQWDHKSGALVGRSIDAINRYSMANVQLRFGGVVNASPNANDFGIYVEEETEILAKWQLEPRSSVANFAGVFGGIVK